MRSGILTYHSLDGSGSIISTGPQLFRRQIEALVARGVPVAPLDQVVSGRQAIALTFDDGYENFAEAALPVLIQFRLPATVFVVSGLCGRSSEWDSAPGIPRLRLMDWATLRRLPDQLISLGAHSVSHPDLTHLPAPRVEAELRNSRSEIEQRTGRPVRWFAYPYGRCNRAVRALAHGQYDLACGTRLRHLPPLPDHLNLPRIDAYYLRRPRRFEGVVVAGEGRWYLRARRVFHSVRSKLWPKGRG